MRFEAASPTPSCSALIASSADSVYGIGLQDRENFLVPGGGVFAHAHDIVDRGLGDGVDLIALLLRGIHLRQRMPDAVLNDEGDLFRVERMVVSPMVEPGRAVNLAGREAKHGRHADQSGKKPAAPAAVRAAWAGLGSFVG